MIHALVKCDSPDAMPRSIGRVGTSFSSFPKNIEPAKVGEHGGQLGTMEELFKKR